MWLNVYDVCMNLRVLNKSETENDEKIDFDWLDQAIDTKLVIYSG